ncbi:hypothetical protein D9M68_690710 [compost metagenome]
MIFFDKPSTVSLLPFKISFAVAGEMVILVSAIPLGAAAGPSFFSIILPAIEACFIYSGVLSKFISTINIAFGLAFIRLVIIRCLAIIAARGLAAASVVSALAVGSPAENIIITLFSALMPAKSS